MIFDEKKITLKDGTEAILKTPGIEDAEMMLENIRICSGETDFLSMYPENWAEKTVESEAKWVKGCRENDNTLLIACFIDGQVVGSSDISFMSGIKTSHRAVLEFRLKDGTYQNVGYMQKIIRRNLL